MKTTELDPPHRTVVRASINAVAEAEAAAEAARQQHAVTIARVYTRGRYTLASIAGELGISTTAAHRIVHRGLSAEQQ